MQYQQPTDNQDKLAWCAHGLAKEMEFINRYGLRLFVCLNPAKELDEQEGKYAPDLFNYQYQRPADLKTVTTPFFTARKYGIDPSHCVTLNRKDVARYQRHYPNIILYFWVSFADTDSYGQHIGAQEGVWIASFDKILLVALNAPVHRYQQRDGTDGNATESYVLSLDALKRVI